MQSHETPPCFVSQQGSSALPVCIYIWAGCIHKIFLPLLHALPPWWGLELRKRQQRFLSAASKKTRVPFSDEKFMPSLVLNGVSSTPVLPHGTGKPT